MVKWSAQRFDTVDNSAFSPKLFFSFGRKKPLLVRRHLRILVARSNTMVYIHVVFVLGIHSVGKHRVDHIAHCVKETKVFPV